MYCSIRNIDDCSYFNGDESQIKELMYDFVNSIEKLLDMTKSDSDVVIIMPKHIPQEYLDTANDLYSVRKNVRFRVSGDLMKGLPCFFHQVADSLDKLKAMCEMGVTDAYVGGQLGFDMPSARKIADMHNVKIRVIPNMAQVSGFGVGHMQEGGNVTAFWIRPEDLHLYEDYVDIIEFIGRDEKQPVFYEIYFVDKKWNGNLGVIIAGLGDVSNRGIPPEFTQRRLDCGKKCLLDKCHSCYKYKSLADLIKENKLEVTFEGV